MAEEHRNDGSDSGRGNHLNSDALVERRSRHEAGQTQEQEKETCPDIHSHHARIVPALASLGLAARVVADPDEEVRWLLRRRSKDRRCVAAVFLSSTHLASPLSGASSFPRSFYCTRSRQLSRIGEGWGR